VCCVTSSVYKLLVVRPSLHGDVQCRLTQDMIQVRHRNWMQCEDTQGMQWTEMWGQPVAGTLSHKAALEVRVQLQGLGVVLLGLPPLACLEGLIASILAAVHQLDALQALAAGGIVWVQPQHHLIGVLG